MAESGKSAVDRRVAGRIAYRGANGGEVGRERFELIAHPGGYILRAMCELDDEALLRDVTLTMDARRRPVDGFVRLLRGGEPLAALSFDVGDDDVRVAGTIGGRRVDERTIGTRGRLGYLGLHPLQGDALIAPIRGTGDPGRFLKIDCVTNSVSPNGDEASGAVLMTIDAAYLGEEMVDVAAGRFAARRYALRWREDWPPADLWVRARDAVFLRMRWPMIPTWYELTDLEES